MEKIYRKQAFALQKRFFQALEILIAEKRIKGVQSFCNEYGLHRAKYATLKKSAKNDFNDLKEKKGSYKFIDLDAPSYLVRDYGISANWLLLGVGDMFVK